MPVFRHFFLLGDYSSTWKSFFYIIDSKLNLDIFFLSGKSLRIFMIMQLVNLVVITIHPISKKIKSIDLRLENLELCQQKKCR
jgi:hypothetical protein